MGLKKKMSFIGRSTAWLAGLGAFFGSIVKALAVLNFWYIGAAMLALICLTVLSIHNEWRRYEK